MTVKSEIRETLQSVRDSTKNAEVKAVAERALQLLEDDYTEDGIVKAGTVLLHELAANKRAERALLWIAPIWALILTAFLFLMLRGFWIGL